MALCTSCGAGNAEGVRYCVKCGTALVMAPPPELWRYSGDLDSARTQPDAPPQPPQYQQQPPRYQQPPPYQSPPSYPQSSPHQHPAPYQQPRPVYGAPQSVAPFQPAPSAAPADSQLPQVAFTLSIVVASLTLVGLVPCLGWLNWFTLFGAKVAIILSIVSLVAGKNPNARSKATIALVIASAAIVVAFIRLVISVALSGGCV
jgi:hypothetical protein